MAVADHYWHSSIVIPIQASTLVVRVLLINNEFVNESGPVLWVLNLSYLHVHIFYIIIMLYILELRMAGNGTVVVKGLT